MTEVVTECPLCGSDNSSAFDQGSFQGQPVSNVICRTCGLVYQSPRMTDDESRVFYEAQYRLVTQGEEGPNPKELSVQAGRASVTLDFVRSAVTSAGQVLDIGCSTGSLLQKFRDYFHARVYGIEPGNGYRQYAQSQGLQVYSSLDELQLSGVARFNLVSMMHVLEHLPHPVKYLATLRDSLLEPGGWLLLEVPNLYAHDSFEIAHLVSYSRHTLEQVLRKAGYQVLRIRQHGLPRSSVIPLYLTLLARPASVVEVEVTPERLVGLKRQAGLYRRRLVERLFPHSAWLPVGEIKAE